MEPWKIGSVGAVLVKLAVLADIDVVVGPDAIEYSTLAV